MKTKVKMLILIAMLQSAAVVAQYSALQINMFDNAAFTVSIDRQQYNTPSSTYIINNLVAGRHHLNIARTMVDYFGRITNQNIFNGYVDIPYNSQVNVIVNQYGQFQVVQTNQFANSYPTNGYRNGNGHRNGHNYQHQNHNNYQAQNQCQAVNNTNQVGFVIQTMANSSFDHSKLAIAKQALATGRYTSADVLSMMQQLSFENSKLQLAKFAYRYVIDPNNYFVVNQGFTFSSSIRDLQRTIL